MRRRLHLRSRLRRSNLHWLHTRDTFITPLLSYATVCPLFPNTQLNDRAIPPKIYDTPRPTARPVLAAWPGVVFHEPAHNAAGAATPPFPKLADALKSPVTTWRAGGLNPSHIDRPATDGRGFAVASDQPGRRTSDSGEQKDI